MTVLRVLVTFAVLLAVLAIAFVVLWPSFRHSAIFPGGELRPGEGDPALWGLPAAEEVWLTTDDGVRIHGWWMPAVSGGVEEPAATDPVATDGSDGHLDAPPGAPRSCGALIYFHGNANTIAPRAWLAERFAGRGLDVLLFDYRGYGLSEGEPGETGLHRDAGAAWEHVTGERGVAPERVVLFGHSLGSAVATELALARPEAAGLVLGAPYPDFPTLFGHHAPWLPLSLLPWEEDRFGAGSRIAGLELPLLVLAGDRDRLIPSRFSRHVYDAAPEPKRWVLTPAEHNTLIGHPESWRALDRFLAERLGCGRAGTPTG